MTKKEKRRTQLEYDREHRTRMKKRGIVRTSVWIPKERKNELKLIAQRWRDAALDDD